MRLTYYATKLLAYRWIISEPQVYHNYILYLYELIFIQIRKKYTLNPVLYDVLRSW